MAGAIGDEGGSDGKIAGLVARKKHLRQPDKVRTGFDARSPGIQRLRGISAQIPHSGVQLCDGDAECCGHVPRSSFRRDV